MLFKESCQRLKNRDQVSVGYPFLIWIEKSRGPERILFLRKRFL